MWLLMNRSFLTISYTYTNSVSSKTLTTRLNNHFSYINPNPHPTQDSVNVHGIRIEPPVNICSVLFLFLGGEGGEGYEGEW